MDRMLIRKSMPLINIPNTGIAPIIFQTIGICFGKPFKQYHMKAAKHQTIQSTNDISTEMIETFLII
jgi:hypothetical protein